MNRFILLLTVVTAFLVSAIPNEAVAQNTGFFFDTIETSSSADTLILYPGGGSGGAASATLSKIFNGRGEMHVYMETDSLSGAAGATAILQYGHGGTPTIWYDKTTTVLNGAAVQKVLTADTAWGFTKWRLYCITVGSTTQKIRVKVSWAFKPNTN